MRYSLLVILAVLAAFCFAESARAQPPPLLPVVQSVTTYYPDGRIVTVHTLADGQRVGVEDNLARPAPAAAPPHVPCEVRPAVKAAPASPCEMCKQLGGCNCTNCACNQVHGVRATGPAAPPVIPPPAYYVPPTYAPTYYVPQAQPMPATPWFSAGVRLGPVQASTCVGAP
jgi:hypothetical protein